MRTFAISGDTVLGNATCTGLVDIFTIGYQPTVKQFKAILDQAYPKERIRRINYVTDFDGNGKFVRHSNHRKNSLIHYEKEFSKFLNLRLLYLLIEGFNRQSLDGICSGFFVPTSTVLASKLTRFLPFSKFFVLSVLKSLPLRTYTL